MKNSKIATAAVMLCALSFGALAANPVPQPGSKDHTQVGIAKATDVEAGSNIARDRSPRVRQWAMLLMFINSLPANGPDISFVRRAVSYILRNIKPGKDVPV
ncbi:Uncharacterised protein [Raoultella terrigena]|uniref:Uncharacterized protein n=1 Tax=Raoultella terrigena TaxID=577 RepID=A0A485BSJ0_RAOTE|nr:Uncharacterised protein [Raoultella terrigena]VUD29203.1 Uncharacterised protein [Raoultella sp. NCTC 9187]